MYNTVSPRRQIAHEGYHDDEASRQRCFFDSVAVEMKKRGECETIVASLLASDITCVYSHVHIFYGKKADRSRNVRLRIDM